MLPTTSQCKLVAVSCSIQTRKYQAQGGNMRYATEVIADEVQQLQYEKNNNAAGVGDMPGEIEFILSRMMEIYRSNEWR